MRSGMFEDVLFLFYPSDLLAYSDVEALRQALVFPSWELFLIDLLAILACLFSHTNVNNNLSSMANTTQFYDAKLRKQFRIPGVHLHWQLIIQPMSIHGRDPGPGRRVRIQRQYPRRREESHRGRRQTQERARSWKSQLISTSNQKVQSCSQAWTAQESWPYTWW